MPSKTPKRRTADPDPYVIVDFVFDRGTLSIAIKNVGTRPAFGVRVEFSHKLMGVGGIMRFVTSGTSNRLIGKNHPGLSIDKVTKTLGIMTTHAIRAGLTRRYGMPVQR